MGVRGLTSYIAQRAEIYLKPYELHSTALVIDGDNLSCNLYKDVSGTYSAFGGDYDDFYRAVVQFFQVLAECNIRPYVLMDGGYEEKKLQTVSTRLRGKISVIKKINPNASITLFPLHLKEVFVDAVRDCGVPVMRCVFEADDELAALARKLNCPVLSYDSDFYIHNVKYIPLITLTVKVLTKQIKDKSNQKKSRDLRRNEAKHVEKRTKANKILNGIQTASKTTPSKPNVKTYKYLDCCIYRVEHLCGRGTLSPEKLPLFAALLGNDYIARSAFRNFFASGMGKAGRSRKLKQQQKRIQVTLKWLKEETSETALAKVLSRLKKTQRESLASQVNAAICGYSNELCHAYDFFEEQYENAFPYVEPVSEDELSVEDEINEGEYISGDDDDEVAEEGQEEDPEPDEQVPEDPEEDEDDEEEAEEEVEVEDKTLLFPAWFLKKLYPAHLSRFFVDLVHLRKYINNPQMEHFPYADSNELALPILNYVFSLLHHVEGEKTEPGLDEEGSPLPIEFTYLTRALRVTNVRHYKMPIEKEPPYPFNPSSPDPRHLRHVFKSFVPHADTDKLFEKLDKLPEDLRLYFLSIIYWIHRSEHCDQLHLHSLLLSLVVLRTIDVTIPAEREVKEFKKRFGKILKQERAVRDKELAEGVKRGIKPSLLELSIPDRMPHVPKSDCYLTQERLLPHFHMQEIFKKKFDLYSSTVIHSFAEFQAVVYQLSGLNALLDFPLLNPRMNQLFCGAFLYNMYDLLKNRTDVRYHVEHFLLPDSKLMFDFYCYLYDWCEEFIPDWKVMEVDQSALKAQQKKRVKKERQASRKAESKAESDPNAELVKTADPDEDFFDLNNKFCGLKVA
ncbi:protein asteroid [Drosophila bipectinata]|uniref:protein asteroid n=1 Tax=Drosophila bipectinata TaxID=42026 RepID=UPI001C89888E|nr:protein asteroid [Drosophila bipectinata]